jgi:hypothetical protein
MQVNVTTEITDEDPKDDPIPSPLVERDLWEQAFEPFEGEHYAALRLGFNFAMLRNYFEGQLIKPPAVMESLDLAMEVLFGYSEFHDASFNLFIRLTEGKLTREEEQMLNALGIKTF